MNELFTRILSGIIYAALIFLGLWFGRTTTLVLFLIFGILCLFEVQKLLSFKNYLCYLIYPLALFAFNYFDVNNKLVFALLVLTFFIKLLLLRDLFSLRGRDAFREKKHIITLLFIIPSFIFLTLIPKIIEVDDNGLFPRSKENYNTFILFAVFLLMWINDSFAYLIGKNFGKNKLFEKISPKKTVEGFLGGFIFTILGGIVLSYFSHLINFYHWVVLGILVSIFGTLGDLVQSKFKRKAEVKDSGKILPGHGGVFDRMDSIIFSSTFALGFLFLIQNVS